MIHFDSAGFLLEDLLIPKVIRLKLVNGVRGVSQDVNNVDRLAFELTILDYIVSFFDENSAPARSTVQVAGLPLAADMEIEAIASLG